MISLKITSKSAVLALVSLLLVALPAFSAVVPAPATGELYLAFRAGGGNGGSDSYIVKIGVDTTFRSAAAGSSFNVSGLGNIANDLAAKYGAGWSSRNDLFWGIFGVRPSENAIIYGSRERTAVGTVTPAWPLIDQISRNTTASQITSVLESIGGYKGRQATANSTVATFQPNSGDASSYAKQVATAGTNDFGSLSEWSSIEGDFAGGATGTALDLYRLAGSGVTRVGVFSITSAGVLNFTAASPTAPVDVDSDGDGVLDSLEVLAGTSPSDPSDFFKVTSVTPSTLGPVVGFKAIPSRTYLIYYTAELGVSPWQLIDSVPGPATAGPFQYTDKNETRKARPKGFYKVAVTN